MLCKKILAQVIATASVGAFVLFPTVSEASPSTLKKGDVNEHVVELQEELSDKGMYDYEVDGIFGSITQQGVKELQRSEGYAVDGIVGKQTYQGLTFDDATEAPKSREVVESASTSTPSSSSHQEDGRTLTVEATHYTAECVGCSGITAGGTDVRSTTTHPSGHGIIAVDPSVIPMGSIVTINGKTYIADDVGGAIKGNKIDILTSSRSHALSEGRQTLSITVHK